MNEYIMNPEPVVEPNAPRPLTSNMDKAQQLSEKAQQLKTAAGEKAQQFKQVAEEKAQQFKQVTEEKAQQFKQVTEEKAVQLKSTAEEKAVALKRNATEQIDVTKEKAKQVQTDLETYIKANPTKSALIAVGVGFVAGLILKK